MHVRYLLNSLTYINSLFLFFSTIFKQQLLLSCLLLFLFFFFLLFCLPYFIILLFLYERDIAQNKNNNVRLGIMLNRQTIHKCLYMNLYLCVYLYIYRYMDICIYIYIFTRLIVIKTKKQWWEMEKIKKRKTVLSTGIFVSISLHIQSLNKINKAFLFVFSKK
jgi:hypothetical protein